jgi:diguanylate cyclase (GGDEF)-like protein
VTGRSLHQLPADLRPRKRTQILGSPGFATAVIDALSSHICVTDRNSVIVAVNCAWRNFIIQNPPISSHAGVGSHYLQICRSASGVGSDDAAKFAEGLQSVLVGKTELFQMEYPCHSPTQNRWFLGRVTPLKIKKRGAVISHMTITDRKMLELDLMKLATTDSLTGLPNRRYFLESANLEAERVGRFGVAASLVMMDLDHFKTVNDKYGHAVGDEVLRCLTQACSKVLRQIDLFARVGGEEFVIMLPGTNEADGVSLAEKLRRAVCETSVASGQSRFTMTASFGVAEISRDDMGADACLGRADAALYAAKRAGRNRVASFAGRSS